MRSATTGHFWFGSFLFSLLAKRMTEPPFLCWAVQSSIVLCLTLSIFDLSVLFCLVMTTLVYRDCWLLWVQLWLVVLGFVILKDISGERRRRNHVDERSWCVMLWSCCVCEVGCHVWGARILLVGSWPVWGRFGDGLFGTVVAYDVGVLGMRNGAASSTFL